MLSRSESSPETSSTVLNQTVENIEIPYTISETPNPTLHRSSTEPISLSQEYTNSQLSNKQFTDLFEVLKMESSPSMEWNETQMSNQDQNLSSVNKIPPNTVDICDFRNQNENDAALTFDNVIDFGFDDSELNKLLENT